MKIVIKLLKGILEMRVNKNEDVIRAWKNGQWAMTGNLSTDGSSLFSYKLRIGQTIMKAYTKL